MKNHFIPTKSPRIQCLIIIGLYIILWLFLNYYYLLFDNIEVNYHPSTMIMITIIFACFIFYESLSNRIIINSQSIIIESLFTTSIINFSEYSHIEQSNMMFFKFYLKNGKSFLFQVPQYLYVSDFMLKSEATRLLSIRIKSIIQNLQSHEAQ